MGMGKFVDYFRAIVNKWQSDLGQVEVAEDGVQGFLRVASRLGMMSYSEVRLCKVPMNCSMPTSNSTPRKNSRVSNSMTRMYSRIGSLSISSLSNPRKEARLLHASARTNIF